MDSVSFRSRHIPVFLFPGILSGLCYVSGFLAVIFLVPIQYVFRKEGKREGLFSMLVSLAVVGLGEALRLSAFGAMQVSFLLQTILPPTLLLLALGLVDFVHADPWKTLVSAAVVLAVAFGFLLQASIGTKEVQESLAAMIGQMFESAGMQGLDTSVITEAYVVPAVSVIFNCFDAVLWLMLAGSWWIGNRLAAPKEKEASDESVVYDARRSTFNVPSWLLWPSIAGWTLLLFVLYGHKDGLVSIVAWNVSLAAVCWYALQGFSVISYFFQSRSVRRMTGLVPVLLIVIILLDIKVGLVVAAFVPILGVSEVWLQYRIHKGA